MQNVGGKIIKRVLVYGGVYHCLAQDFHGKIHHCRFSSQKQAMRYMLKFQSDIIEPEYL